MAVLQAPQGGGGKYVASRLFLLPWAAAVGCLMHDEPWRYFGSGTSLV